VSKTINVTLSTSSFDKAIREIRAYKEWVERKAKELARRLADEGAWLASLKFEATEVFYEGDAECNVTVEQRGENTKVSWRSACGFDVAAIAGVFGGGGHSAAAGATIFAGMDEAIPQVIKVTEEALKGFEATC
jgi:nanoRNase/pAp phosphatase (c-di-AMP/oligoRNAs hydrolase)